jgi:hypothetical protein
MDNTDVLIRLKRRVERQIEQREAELVPFHEYVRALEKAGYDSSAARYVLGRMTSELGAWGRVLDGLNSFGPVGADPLFTILNAERWGSFSETGVESPIEQRSYGAAS